MILTMAANEAHVARVQDILTLMRPLVSRTLIITTEPYPLYLDGVQTYNCGNVINYAHWKNLGLDWAMQFDDTVILLNADVSLRKRDIAHFRAMERELQRYSLVGPATHAANPYEERTELRPVEWWCRVAPSCLLVRSDCRIRYDTDYPWFFESDDYEWQHIAYGGVRIYREFVIRESVSNRPPSGAPADSYRLGEQRFLKKWGVLPW